MRRFKRWPILVLMFAVVSLMVHVLMTAYAVLCVAWLFFYTITIYRRNFDGFERYRH